MSDDYTRRSSAFPSHGSMGEIASPGISIAMLMTAHAMQGLIAGTVARNGAESLRDSDAQGELANLAVALSDSVVGAVNVELEREHWDWTQRLADRRLKALTKLAEVAGSMTASAALESASEAVRTEYMAALSEAREAIEDNDIPF